MINIIMAHFIDLQTYLFLVNNFPVFVSDIINKIRLYTLLPYDHLHLCPVMNRMKIQLQNNILQRANKIGTIKTNKINLCQ